MEKNGLNILVNKNERNEKSKMLLRNICKCLCFNKVAFRYYSKRMETTFEDVEKALSSNKENLEFLQIAKVDENFKEPLEVIYFRENRIKVLSKVK